MTFLLAASNLLRMIARRVGQVAAWCVVFLILTVVLDVITRRFIVLGSTKLQDLEWHFHAALFLLCLGYAYVEGEHVRIDVLHARFGPKTAAVIELIGATLFLAPFCIIVLSYGWGFVAHSFQLDEGSPSLTGLPHRWIVKSALLVGFATLLIAALSAITGSLATLLGAPPPRSHHDEHQEVGL
ncbi:TRAP transporter small permease subunit [Ancylobacter pratisalsi]|uniref:TRAP transporter small permease protein n=1 Tax=Ancylobacter pratisalsi TaxID=1745854 RepID=A0A6P1YT96_9HYPH|nr:TRAP transporter small permease subunit [Ancylobacter pratisalsi]QIB34904.1 TRAP transporter small permease subunit [Ancylobacter pratisalsi]